MVSRTAKNSQRSRRGSSANATAPGGRSNLAEADVGDKIEVKYKDYLWYPATVIAKRGGAGGVPQLRYSEPPSTKRLRHNATIAVNNYFSAPTEDRNTAMTRAQLMLADKVKADQRK